MRQSRSRRVLAFASSLALLAALLPGCGESPQASGGDSPETVRVSGSGTCRPLVQMLTDTYDNDEVEFSFLPGLHSGGGIKGVANGDLELGTVSRELTQEEQNLGLMYTALSSDGLLMAAHRDIPVENISIQQVKDIYAGKTTNWSEVGGPDIDITVLDRNEDESAKIILREYVLGPDLEVTERAVNLFYEPDMVDALEKTPGSIGYFSLGYAISRDIQVRHLKLDGVEATVENIEAGAYKVVRPLGVVTGKSPSETLSAFLAWARGDEAKQIMVSKGYAPPVQER